jgi:hypothetical protein
VPECYCADVFPEYYTPISEFPNWWVVILYWIMNHIPAGHEKFPGLKEK